MRRTHGEQDAERGRRFGGGIGAAAALDACRLRVIDEAIAECAQSVRIVLIERQALPSPLSAGAAVTERGP